MRFITWSRESHGTEVQALSGTDVRALGGRSATDVLAVGVGGEIFRFSQLSN